MIQLKVKRAGLLQAACVLVWWLPALHGGAQRVEANFTRYVNPYIGTGFHGHVFLGASVPFGAVQLGPVNRSEGWDWCSGYHYSDSTIIGFSHTHLSGTGIGDLGDILVMPAIGTITPKKGEPGNPASGYLSLFSREDELARPGYYGVRLQRYNVEAELTASTRVGFHQYTFPQSDSAQLIFDLKEGIGWDNVVEASIARVNDTTIAGYRYSKGWAPDQRIYFTAVFSRPLKGFTVYEDSTVQPGQTLTGKRVKAIAWFTTGTNEKIKLKVGISPVSIENALANIQAEVPHWNFKTVVAQADAAWNRELGKVKVNMTGVNRLQTFYTALYHTMIAPSVYNDHNGEYMGTDKKVYRQAAFTNLTTFSLWDTYRGAHPLFTILQPNRVNDMVSSMLAIYQQQGTLPVWHLVGNETNTMPGYSAVQVVADAYLKGFCGFDTALAYEAVKATAMQDKRGVNFVKLYGYIPADSMVESVAMGLEYAIADWAIAQMARRMGKQADYQYFSRRAKNYRNYFDTAAGFMRGRLSSTQWRTPFSPFEARHMKDDFAEGNAWQYTWLVPHDVEGLMEIMGGEKAFAAKLDSLFVLNHSMGSEASNDITGLIGQYAHGNEPSHHIAYLYAFVGRPWKTADKVRYILDSLYSNRTNGLCGNEDVGQMSAWYVLSALGFYPVNPANGMYILGSPLVNSATLLLPGNKTLQVQVSNNSAVNKYIQKVVLNGKVLRRSYILHSELARGGTLHLYMGPTPSATFGVRTTDRPYSAIKP